MKVTKTEFEDLLIIEPLVYKDTRGYFFEGHNTKKFFEQGIDYHFIQDNQSFSNRGVIRGLHYQIKPYAQAKLVRVLQGEILDVVVDIRKESVTYGKFFSIILNSDNKKQLMIPQGFAHGFSVLSKTASVLYKVDEVYHKESERGIRFDDPTLNIDWKINSNEIIVSEKDLILPNFNENNTVF